MIGSKKILATGLLVLGGLLAAALPVAAADQQVVQGSAIAGHGTLLVASSNGMTVYTFTKDVANSGTSACTGACLTNWPALTIAAGNTPTGAGGLTSHLGTITRSDNGQHQVTFDGKPLYFFHNDAKPGDTNGIYPNWEAVSVQAVAGATSAPSSGSTPAATSTAPAQAPASSLSWLALALLLVAGATGSLVFAVRRSSRRR